MRQPYSAHHLDLEESSANQRFTLLPGDLPACFIHSAIPAFRLINRFTNTAFSKPRHPMAKRKDRDLERTYSRAQFVAKLRRLTDSLETGKAFTIQVAGERMRLPADVVFNIEHERTAGEDELEFQLRWKAEA